MNCVKVAYFLEEIIPLGFLAMMNRRLENYIFPPVSVPLSGLERSEICLESREKIFRLRNWRWAPVARWHNAVHSVNVSPFNPSTGTHQMQQLCGSLMQQLRTHILV